MEADDWGRGVPAAASPPTGSPLQYSPALRRVTTGFGMGPGGATALSATGTPRPPTTFPLECVLTARNALCSARFGFRLVATCEAPARVLARWCGTWDARASCPAGPSPWSPRLGNGARSVARSKVCPRSLGRVSSGRLPAVHLAPINPVVFRGSYLLTQWDTSSWEKIPA